MPMYVCTHKNLFFALNMFILKARYSHVGINFFEKSLIQSFTCVQIKNIEKDQPTKYTYFYKVIKIK